jgi:hypothetical protein
MAVVGNGNAVAENNSPICKTGQPTVESPAESDGPCGKIDQQSPKSERPRICGAMSQQRGHSGHESAPQKLVQLVGCRDSKVRTEPWVRPRAAPVS